MGMYSDWDIKIRPSNQLDEIMDALVEESGGYHFDRSYYDGDIGLNDAKWYSDERDILAVSSKFPKVLFEVHKMSEEHREYRYDVQGGIVRTRYKKVWEAE